MVWTMWAAGAELAVHQRARKRRIVAVIGSAGRDCGAALVASAYLVHCAQESCGRVTAQTQHVQGGARWWQHKEGWAT
ncbi:hypothetical protein HaLaN_23458 [Haematococcus lacustris]|uniref:Uncharacterized protein n=1 Tax=Haematococcus lacustris TaxID=44745 RepID=A0A6A0A4F4_HAELA|nr:hypothetical protein HaLaN_23458 [Haematococcus lacustris]